MTETPKTCVICRRPFSFKICWNSWTVEHGNNAAPASEGKCCDECNANVVLPARIQLARKQSESAT